MTKPPAHSGLQPDHDSIDDPSPTPGWRVPVVLIAILSLLFGFIATTMTTEHRSFPTTREQHQRRLLSTSSSSTSSSPLFPSKPQERASSSSSTTTTTAAAAIAAGSQCQTDSTVSHKDDSLLLIATVPQTKLHLQSLWSMIQCMSVGYNHVVVAAPLAARSVIESTQKLAVHEGLHPNLDFIFVRNNNRYDVGLWCEALEYAGSANYKYITLVNDSIMVLRHSRVVLDKLETHHYDLVGMSYSHTGGSFWIESYIRGFSQKGIAIFEEHSCGVPPSHPSFATKRSVVDYHEIGMVNTYFSDTKQDGKLLATGLYPGDLPEDWVGRGDSNRTWVATVNLPYWKRALLKGHLFPIAKLKMPQMISWSTKHYHDCKVKQIPQHMAFVDDDERTWSWKQVFAATTVGD